MNPTPTPALSRSMALVLGLGLGMLACTPGHEPKAKVNVTYDEWEALDPGAPPLVEPDRRARTGEVLHEGQGPEVALGDLVELHLRTRLASSSRAVPGARDEGLGWVWIAFDGPSTSDFRTTNDTLAAALMGFREGSVHTFVTHERPYYSDEMVGYAGQLPFGDRQWYSDHIARAKIDKSSTLGGGIVYADRGPNKDATLVEVTRVCKGQALQRLVSLMDNSPIRLANTSGFFDTHVSTEPRWKYLREAKWEGRCNDGAQVRFQYGPYFVGTPRGKPDDSSVTSDLPWLWLKEAWSKVPLGVVVH